MLSVLPRLYRFIRSVKVHNRFAIFKEIGDRARGAIASSGLGKVASAIGEYEQAKTHLYEALRTATEMREVPLALETLEAIAELMSQEGVEERALESLALVLHHPASSQRTQSRAQHWLSELESQVPPQLFVSAQERGKAKELEDLVEEILGNDGAAV